MNNDRVSDYDMGFNSPIWMLKSLVMNADDQMLRYGVNELLNYLCYSENADLATAFDVLAQITSVGYYTPTYEHSCEDEADGHTDRRLDPTTRHLFTEPESSLGEEEAERLIKEFNAMMGVVPTTEEEENNE